MLPAPTTSSFGSVSGNIQPAISPANSSASVPRRGVSTRLSLDSAHRLSHLRPRLLEPRAEKPERVSHDVGGVFADAERVGDGGNRVASLYTKHDIILVAHTYDNQNNQNNQNKNKRTSLIEVATSGGTAGGSGTSGRTWSPARSNTLTSNEWELSDDDSDESPESAECVSPPTSAASTSFVSSMESSWNRIKRVLGTE